MANLRHLSVSFNTVADLICKKQKGYQELTSLFTDEKRKSEFSVNMSWLYNIPVQIILNILKVKC